MRHDHPRRPARPQRMENRFARQTVKAVLANARVPEFLRQRQPRRRLGQRPVKRRIETRKLRHARKKLLRLSNQLQRHRDVQRRKMLCRLQFLQNLRRNFLVLGQRWPAMHHPMPDRPRTVAADISDNFSATARAASVCAGNACVSSSNVFPSSPRTHIFPLPLANPLRGPTIERMRFIRTPSEHAELQRRRPAIHHKNSITAHCEVVWHKILGSKTLLSTALVRRAPNSVSHFHQRVSLLCYFVTSLFPFPIRDFGHVLAVLGNIQLVPLHHLREPLCRLVRDALQPRYPPDHIQRQLKPVHAIEHHHVKRRGSRSLFHVSPHMKVVDDCAAGTSNGE